MGDGGAATSGICGVLPDGSVRSLSSFPFDLIYPPRDGGGATSGILYTMSMWMRTNKGLHGTYRFSVYDDTDELAFSVDNYSRCQKVFACELPLINVHHALLLPIRLLLTMP